MAPSLPTFPCAGPAGWTRSPPICVGPLPPRVLGPPASLCLVPISGPPWASRLWPPLSASLLHSFLLSSGRSMGPRSFPRPMTQPQCSSERRARSHLPAKTRALRHKPAGAARSTAVPKFQEPTPSTPGSALLGLRTCSPLRPWPQLLSSCRPSLPGPFQTSLPNLPSWCPFSQDKAAAARASASPRPPDCLLPHPGKYRLPPATGLRRAPSFCLLLPMMLTPQPISS